MASVVGLLPLGYLSGSKVTNGSAGSQGICQHLMKLDRCHMFVCPEI